MFFLPGCLLGSGRWFSGVFRVHLRQRAQRRRAFFTAPQVHSSFGFFVQLVPARRSQGLLLFSADLFCCFLLSSGFLGFLVAAVSAAYRSRINGSGQLRCGFTSSPFCWLGCSAADCLLGSLFDWFSLLVLFVTGLGLWKWRKLP